jgi:hypothetical protein
MTNAELLSTNDAMVWAKEFVACMKRNNWTLEDIDEVLMVGWFANAMVAQEYKDQPTFRERESGKTFKWCNDTMKFLHTR